MNSGARLPKLLILLLLFSFVTRIAWGLFQPGNVDARLPDQREYLELGRNLLHRSELKFFDARLGEDVYAYRAPGYPIFVALCGGNLRAIRIVQAGVDTSTVLAVYLLARRFLHSNGILFAAAAVSVNPFLIYFCALVLSETLFTAMLAWGMVLLVRQQRVGLFVLCLSALVRPSAVGLVVLLAIGAAWPLDWRRIAKDIGITAVLLFATLFPWAWRNAHHPKVGAWIWTTTNEGITAYDGFNDRATGASNQGAFVPQMKNLLAHMDEVERDRYLSQEAHRWMDDHPAEVLKLAAKKIARTWSPVPLSNEYGGRWLYVAVGLFYGLPFDALVLVGLWKSALPRNVKVFLLIPAIYFTVIHALSVGSMRYRVPCEAPMAVVAGSGVVWFVGRWHGPSRRKLG